MASTLKKGQSVFIPFVGDASVLDSQNRPRMYKSVEQFKKSYPLFRLEQPELVEYAPVVHAEWKSVYGTHRPRVACTNCKYDVKSQLKYYKRCPNCGAKMDGGK